MSRQAIIGILCAGFYFDCGLATNSIPIPPKPNPSYFYPVLPVIIEPNPYENDCYGVEDDYCWGWSYMTMYVQAPATETVSL